MTETTDLPKIDIQKVTKSRLTEVNLDPIPFGRIFSDHMFISDYKDGAWKNLRIIPYGKISISPATPAVHYGQAVFEGMKAYRNPADKALLFRPYDNFKRMNISAKRMCIPPFPENMFLDSIKTLVDLDRKWIPVTPGGALYIRPIIFSVDEYIGIGPSDNYQFMIITCPVDPYYSTPLKVKIETTYTRAVAGGTGFAKAGGNYAGANYPSALALHKGYHQLIWTDGVEHRYIEESGTMNIMFVIGETLVTPVLSDSILAGITRDSVLKIARHWGIKVEERRILVDDLVEALKSGEVKEAFGTGTAATIAPIQVIGYDGIDFKLPPPTVEAFSNRVLKELDEIKRGLTENVFNWNLEI